MSIFDERIVAAIKGCLKSKLLSISRVKTPRLYSIEAASENLDCDPDKSFAFNTSAKSVVNFSLAKVAASLIKVIANDSEIRGILTRASFKSCMTSTACLANLSNADSG